MKSEVLIIGSGMGSLSAAVLLCSKGWKIRILEQGKTAGGCSSSFERNGYIFESGATTLVGLDEGMPLNYLLKQANIDLNARILSVPMRVILRDGTEIIRYKELDKWIKEVKKIFGSEGQEEFWKECFAISKLVWNTSLKQLTFPPNSISDLLNCAKNVNIDQLKMIPSAFISMETLLKKYNLHLNKKFVEFVDEQLIITAQNTNKEVNALFGATALCYTNYGNYYMDGGLISLINKLENYLIANGSEIIYNEEVIKIDKGYNYFVQTKSNTYQSKNIISGIPLNNLYDLLNKNKNKDSSSPYTDKTINTNVQKLEQKLFTSKKLSGAFTMGIVLNGKPKNNEILHHQLHFENQIKGINSKSIFISFSHSEDKLRTKNGKTIANISTHIHDPENFKIENKDLIAEQIINFLIEKDLFKREQIDSYHSTTPQGWENWTKRKFGFVGGYPQFMKVKPWQMQNARLEKGLYLVGDSVYPGQGIPGVTLSGIIAAYKIMNDN